MGHGITKEKKAKKLYFLAQATRELERAQTEINRLQAENKLLKEDPNGVIKQFLDQYNSVVIQNNRMSALCAALIDQLNGRVEVTKEKIKSFEGMRLTIKIEAPEGIEKFEDSDRYIFSYEATKVEPPPPPAKTDTPSPPSPSQTQTEEKPAEGLPPGSQIMV
jgi:hypothetical protein